MSKPKEPGWYATVLFYDLEEGPIPSAAEWTGERWREMHDEDWIARFYPVRFEAKEDAERFAFSEEFENAETDEYG